MMRRRKPPDMWTTASCALAGVLIFFSAGACSNSNDLADAYGNFEATEILVSAETSGRLVTLNLEEGNTVNQDEVVGLVDTVQLALQRSQLLAGRQAVRSKLGEIAAQIAVLQEQRRVAETERDRIARLLRDGAATSKARDDVDGQIAVVSRQIEQAAARRASIRAEIAALDAQIAQVNDLIQRATITSPIGGTVLTKFVEQHELVTAGRPLYKIADLSTMELRAYVSGSQLPHIRIGQDVDVQIDDDRTSNRSFIGRIAWISDQAEFTPKLIQTKEERVNLVYAFKVRVDNESRVLKVGMPGEVRFGALPDNR